MQFTQGLHRAIQQNPKGIASRFEGRSRTFGEVGVRVARFASALKRLGVSPGDRIAMLGHNSDRYLEYWLATPWAGAVLNPVNTRWSVPEIVYSLEDSGSAILIVDDAFAPQVDAIRRDSPSIRHVIHAGDGPCPAGLLSWEALVQAHAPAPDAGRRGPDLCGLFYTGGTTGFPKGVMLSHENLCISGLGLLAEGLYGDGTIFLHTAPMFHLADGAQLVAVLLRGGTHAILPGFRPDRVLQAIQDERVTEVMLVPTMIQAVSDHPDVRAYDTSSLRHVVYGASPISEAVLDRAMAALPSAGFLQAYGMTELSPVATVLLPALHAREGRAAGKIRSGGRAAFHNQVRIVDADDREVPRGTVGEIVARGPNVMQGYWNKPKETAEALRGGWMHTGDMACMDDDGFVFVVDRLKDMIVTGGENVYCTEVEQAVARHEAVAACAVIGIPSPEWGESVHAVVVLKPGASLTAEELHAHCKPLIANYKCPRSLEVREALPVSGAGKILKSELRKPHWAGQSRGVA